MAVKYKHSDTYSMYYCTFTCYQWIPLFELTNGYDIVYDWLSRLKNDIHAETIAYVIMPNHLHSILYFQDEKFDLNIIIGNGKRFMAYEIVNRLEERQRTDILSRLESGLTFREIKKGQKHRIFENSFDAKPIFTDRFLLQKIDYIHHNPTSGKWKLAVDFVDYEHSSASFYECNQVKHFKPMHYLNL